MLRLLALPALFIIASLAQCDPAVLASVAAARAGAFQQVLARTRDNRSIAVQVAALAPFVTADFSIKAASTGTFGGPNHGGLEGAVEYAFAVNPNFNRGFYVAVSTPPPAVSLVDFDTLRFVFTNAVVTNWLGQTATIGFEWLAHYDGCTAKLRQVELSVDRNALAFTQGGLRSPMDTCVEIQANCVGANQQFQTVNECANFLAGLPTNNCQETFKGDNFPCRFLHHLLTKTNPNVHCPHTGYNSVPCSAPKCDHPINTCSFDINYANC